MAFGDVGGAVTELVITCSTPKEGNVYIMKGDPVVLLDRNYTVDNNFRAQHVTKSIFGQSLTDTDRCNQAIPIKIRGICVFEAKPGLEESGCIGLPASMGSDPLGVGPDLQGKGTILCVRDGEIHVLL